METATLKEEFHKLIESYEDENRLYLYFHLMKEENEVDIFDELTPEQEQRLEESIVMADRNEGIPHEIAMIKFRKWAKNL